jgi:hypothetical protein
MDIESAHQIIDSFHLASSVGMLATGAPGKLCPLRICLGAFIGSQPADDDNSELLPAPDPNMPSLRSRSLRRHADNYVTSLATLGSLIGIIPER